MWRTCYISKKRMKEKDEKFIFLSIPKNINNYVKIPKKSIRKEDNDYYVVNLNLDGKYWIINNDKKYLKIMFGNKLFDLYYDEYNEHFRLNNSVTEFEKMDINEKEKEIKKKFETIKNNKKKWIKNKNFNKKIKTIVSGTLFFIVMIVLICLWVIK